MGLANTRIALLIPSYNDSGLFLEVFVHMQSFLMKQTAKIPSTLFQVVVIDDGSNPPMPYADLQKYLHSSFSHEVYLLRHPVNLGQGAALCTGIQFAYETLKSDIFVTLDADGQHSLEDLPRLLEPVRQDHYDIVFGNRFAEHTPHSIPWLRRLLLLAAANFERVLTRMDLNDAHNGFRAFNRKTASCLQLRQNRMAHATEFKQIIARKRLRYTELPVSIVYTKELLARGQSNANALNILKDLLKHYIFGKS